MILWCCCSVVCLTLTLCGDDESVHTSRPHHQARPVDVDGGGAVALLPFLPQLPWLTKDMMRWDCLSQPAQAVAVTVAGAQVF